MKRDILIVGVGGQGTLLSSRILGALAEELGLQCKLSEVHGMSQRGGSVVTHVRVGEEIAAPTVTEGEADFVLAFEKLEAMRWCHYLSDTGVLLMNRQEMMPMPVITGQREYPQGIEETLRKDGVNLVAIDALSLAKEADNPRAVNVVLIGALCRLMGVEIDKAERAVAATVKPKTVESNLKALRLGYSSIG